MFKNIHIIEYIYFRMCALYSIEKKEGRKGERDLEGVLETQDKNQRGQCQDNKRGRMFKKNRAVNIIKFILQRKASFLHLTHGVAFHCCNPYQKLSCPSEYGNRTDEKPPSETEGRKDQHLAFETSHLSQVTHPKMIQQCADQEDTEVP